MEEERAYTAFAGEHLVAAGGLRAMLGKVKSYLDDGGGDRVLIFEDWTGRQVDFDFRGTPEEVVERADPGGPRTGPGRPKLGVVAREVTLLPRHWEWLERQPSGASAALRRLVDEARKREPGKERARLALEAASKVMWAMAGDLPNFGKRPRGPCSAATRPGSRSSSPRGRRTCGSTSPGWSARPRRWRRSRPPAGEAQPGRRSSTIVHRASIGASIGSASGFSSKRKVATRTPCFRMR